MDGCTNGPELIFLVRWALRLVFLFSFQRESLAIIYIYIYGRSTKDNGVRPSVVQGFLCLPAGDAHRKYVRIQVHGTRRHRSRFDLCGCRVRAYVQSETTDRQKNVVFEL